MIRRSISISEQLQQREDESQKKQLLAEAREEGLDMS